MADSSSAQAGSSHEKETLAQLQPQARTDPEHKIQSELAPPPAAALVAKCDSDAATVSSLGESEEGERSPSANGSENILGGTASAKHETGAAISETEADKVAATLSKDEKPSTTPPMPEAARTAAVAAGETTALYSTVTPAYLVASACWVARMISLLVCPPRSLLPYLRRFFRARCAVMESMGLGDATTHIARVSQSNAAAQLMLC